MLSTRQSLYLKKQAAPKRQRYFGQPLDRGRGKHRPKFVCLACRHVIRVSRMGYNNYAKGCGNCGGVVYPVSPMFKPPRANTRRGKKAWMQIARSISYRIRFYAERRQYECR